MCSSGTALCVPRKQLLHNPYARFSVLQRTFCQPQYGRPSIYACSTIDTSYLVFFIYIYDFKMEYAAVPSKTWELSLYELHRTPQEAITDGTEIAVSPRSLHSELMCPICLDMLKNTMTTKECLHRYRDCELLWIKCVCCVRLHMVRLY